MGLRALAAAVAATFVLAGCTVEGSPTVSYPPPVPNVTATAQSGALIPSGTPEILATGLTSPWSVVLLDSGSALISERDTANVIEFNPREPLRVAGIVPDVDHGGEGGLLGLTVVESDGKTTLYAYLTTASDNRIVRMPLLGTPGDYTLGTAKPILTGLDKAGNHNGGRIAVGPDGKLYATVGDAGKPDRAQDMTSLNGKILRMNLDGSVPSDNPFPDSLVYSFGHRNPQGLAWDADGQLWASEFGQNTWDELNLILAGKNYGWPTVEGKAGRAGFVDPAMQWSPAEASPSGLAYVGNTFFMATLRGKRLWAIDTSLKSYSEPQASAWFEGEYGRLRDAVQGPHGTLWMLTNNTDGRGSPKPDDDKLLQITLAPRPEGQ